MLVLTRRINEEIVIDGNIRIRVLDSHHDRVRLGVSAPADVRVDRLEVAQQRAANGNHEPRLEMTAVVGEPVLR
jgi:carbon storage regulator